MANISPQYFNNIAQYLKAPVGKISKAGNLYTRVNSNQLSTGTINIIVSLLRESKSRLGPSDILEEAQIYQWLEYAIVYAGNATSSHSIQILLKELEKILSSKTYLVNNRLTIADVSLYYVLVNIMANLANLEKEKYLSVSRWFDNIQQDPALRQKHRLVDFSTNYLAKIVPSRH